MNKIAFFIGLRWFYLMLMLLALDFSTKQLVLSHLHLGEIMPVIQFINFTYIYNPGAAFSFLANAGGWQRWLISTFTIITIIIIIIMMIYYLDKQDVISNIACAMIVGGALGNLFDRIVYGAVIDFIDFHIGNWHWPTFNIADVSITIGITLFVVKNFSYYK